MGSQPDTGIFGYETPYGFHPETGNRACASRGRSMACCWDLVERLLGRPLARAWRRPWRMAIAH